MESLLKEMNKEASECWFNAQDIQRCPFLRNVNIPTRFNLSSVNFSNPARGAKGPIFEDEDKFDLAFKLFHGKNGVVPLSDETTSHDVMKSETIPPQFNPLAAKAATISLSSFGPGGPFNFDSFSRNWKNKKQRSDSAREKKPSAQEEYTKHEANGNDWLETGNCPIAKSHRAISRVLPQIASVLQPPPGLKLKCPPAIVAARAALSKTAFAKNLRPQPLPTKVLVIGVMGMAANIPLGIWREHTRKFSVSWFAAVHAAVPFIAILRKSLLMPKYAMAMTIAASILGQVIGSRAERIRLNHKKTAANNVDGFSAGQCRKEEGLVWDPRSGKSSSLTTSVTATTSSSDNLCF